MWKQLQILSFQKIIRSLVGSTVFHKVISRKIQDIPHFMLRNLKITPIKFCQFLQKFLGTHSFTTHLIQKRVVLTKITQETTQYEVLKLQKIIQLKSTSSMIEEVSK